MGQYTRYNSMKLRTIYGVDLGSSKVHLSINFKFVKEFTIPEFLKCEWVIGPGLFVAETAVFWPQKVGEKANPSRAQYWKGEAIRDFVKNLNNLGIEVRSIGHKVSGGYGLPFAKKLGGFRDVPKEFKKSNRNDSLMMCYIGLFCYGDTHNVNWKTIRVPTPTNENRTRRATVVHELNEVINRRLGQQRQVGHFQLNEDWRRFYRWFDGLEETCANICSNLTEEGDPKADRFFEALTYLIECGHFQLPRVKIVTRGLRKGELDVPYYKDGQERHEGDLDELKMPAFFKAVYSVVVDENGIKYPHGRKVRSLLLGHNSQRHSGNTAVGQIRNDCMNSVIQRMRQELGLQKASVKEDPGREPGSLGKLARQRGLQLMQDIEDLLSEAFIALATR